MVVALLTTVEGLKLKPEMLMLKIHAFSHPLTSLILSEILHSISEISRKKWVEKKDYNNVTIFFVLFQLSSELVKMT